MPFSDMWHRVALVRTDVWDERIGIFIELQRISDLRTT
jgi:hypothetical protein